MDRAYALRSVRLTLVLERAEPHSIEVRPATPTQNREVLLKLLKAAMRQAFSSHHSLGGCLSPGEVIGSLMGAP